jgi:hypothetical protein
VHDKVGDIKADTSELRVMLGTVVQQLGASGQTTVYPTSHDLLRALTRITRESFARDQDTPQILRIARFAGEPQAIRADPEYEAEFQGFNDAIKEGLLSSGGRADSKTRWWSIRIMGAVWNIDHLNFILERLVGPIFERHPLNFELKFLVQSKIQHALLSPVITDREAMLTFDDVNAMFRWGILFQGRQYTMLFARWFDEVWTSIPDSHLVYSRGGLNESAIDLIKKELERSDVTTSRQTS